MKVGDVMPGYFKGLSPRMNRIARILWGFMSMVIIAFAVHLEVLADIGLFPWDSLNVGLSNVLPITMGTASISVGAIIIVVDLALKEKIGFCTLMDTFIIGSVLDVFNEWRPIPYFDSFIYRVFIFFLALIIFAFGLYLYMSCGLSCGPRDTLVVAIGKRVRKLSVGTVTTIIHFIVLVVSWLLGSTIGVGTLLSLTCFGLIWDFVNMLLHFEPRDVIHEDVVATIKVIITNSGSNITIKEKNDENPVSVL